MGIHYVDLNDNIRGLMLEELELDIATGNLLRSAWLSERGQREWPDLVREAIGDGNDDTLAEALRAEGRLNTTATRRKPKGGFTNYRVPDLAPNLIAEGEFNRYYVRGVCRAAVMRDGANAEVVIYRGKAVSTPRRESEAKIGARFPAAAILDDLRGSVGLEPTLGLPPGPNSGLTAKLL